MNANAKFDATLRRKTGVALNHAVLNLNCATHRVHYATELDDRAVTGALDDTPVVDCDRGIEEVAAQSAQSREDALFVRACQSTVADDVGGQNRHKFPGSAHGSPSAA